MARASSMRQFGLGLMASTVAVVTIMLVSQAAASDQSVDKPSPSDWMSLQQPEYSIPTSVVQLIPDAFAAADVSVVSIDAPAFNSADGSYWDGVPSKGVFAEVYSTVHVKLVEQWTGEQLPSEFDIRVLGDAAERIESDSLPSYSGVSGGFSVGDDFVVLLSNMNFSTQLGSVAAWTTDGGFLANWRIDGQKAIDSYTPFSTDASTLQKLLVSNWGR